MNTSPLGDHCNEGQGLVVVGLEADESVGEAQALDRLGRSRVGHRIGN